MMFKSRPVGLFTQAFLVAAVAMLSQGAFAAKQTITCNNSVNVVLFGLQATYGEVFNSGLTNVSVDGAPSTITVLDRLGEAKLSDSLFRGTDYDGNIVVIQLPKGVIGKDAETPFSAMAKLVLSQSKQEKTLEIQCVSQVSP